jgi:ubiquinone/menaquinone biosynthesis C-methylase UbiE
MQKFPLNDFRDCHFLMVGCGNSKLSEEMSQHGYRHITNIDISDNVIHKMKNHYSCNFPHQEYAVIDATHMAYRDNTFDVCIDKGTFDALACGFNSDIPVKLVSEMMRVCRVATVIVTSGGPEKRMAPFLKVTPNIEYQKIEVSKLA